MLNTVVLIGRLTADPELRYTRNDKAVSNFSIAVNRRFSKDRDEADFFNVTCWGKVAENVAEYMEKGRLVAVNGELRQNRWTTDQGQKRSRVEVNAQQVQFLDWGDKKKKGRDSGAGTASTNNTAMDDLDYDENDVPF